MNPTLTLILSLRERKLFLFPLLQGEGQGEDGVKE
jgi:hypothetical protein